MATGVTSGAANAEEPGGRPRRWTEEEYYLAAELGIFRPDERLELIRGEVVQKGSPQKRWHFAAITRGAKLLEAVFGPEFYICPQGPMRISETSIPEPDLLVVVGSSDDYSDHPGPGDVRLLVEIADTTLRFDRGTKAALYAEAGIADYWIENLPERRLEVYRDPAPLPDGSGFGYHSVASYTEKETVTPLAAPQAVILVADILPPVRPAGKAEKEN